ncbi:hypothetical protein P43SY_009141 [Pythium insidiosum]|uniref:ABC transporter domain-containing protein n=1 Tax=Pythium insidiosum TaxID=114742 RepID=A0AAD5M4W3_PYTIN|nr:hypothetical protein P43SY_009141 [Pythium insidiosum]
MSTPIAASSLDVTPPNATCDPHYEKWNATTKSCDCRPGFSGLNCRMCHSSAACQTAFAQEGGDYTCATGLKYRNTSATKTYDCMLDPSLQAFFSDGALAVECNRSTQMCHAAVFKSKQGWRSDHVIECTLTGCTFSNGSGNGKCAKIECMCGHDCSAVTKAVVEEKLSGKPAKIRVSNGTSLAIDIEDTPFPLSATCHAAACERVDSGGSGSGSGGGGDDKPSLSPLVIALLVCAGLVALLLLGVCCCACSVRARLRSSRMTKDEMDMAIRALASKSGEVLEFRHVNCRVATRTPTDGSEAGEPKRILSDLSGVVQRGHVLGLLGPSGSGKTSLLNALAAVENGSRATLTGEVLVDGRKISKDYRKIAAYVQQDDTLYTTLTVRECLTYSAELRLPASVPEAVKHEMVSRIITELNLSHVQHSRIGGGTGHRGISGGERRRVSIGMELVTSPQILFLDEPTSGLDSSSANAVVQLVKDLASHGRIVVMSIHQPSAKAFMLLDQVVLLAKGRMLYDGAPQDAKSYFERVGFKCPENENVADFILDIASNTENIPMVRAAFKEANPKRHAPARIRLEPLKPAPTAMFKAPATSSESSPFMSEDVGLDTPRVYDMTLNVPGTPATPSNMTRSPPSPPGMGSPTPLPRAQGPQASDPPTRSLWIELSVLFRRTALNIFRHRSLLLLHLALSILLGIFGGIIFNHVTNDLAGFQNRSGAFYFILTFFGFASMSSMDVFISERSIFLRETGAMYYGAFSYFIAKAVLDTVLLRVLPATCFASIFYWLMGLQSSIEHFTMFLVTLLLFNIAAGSISILLGVLSRNVGLANLIATVVFLVMLLFGGFLLNSQTMPKSVGWIKHFSIFSYAFEILMTNELKGLLLKFDAPGACAPRSR